MRHSVSKHICVQEGGRKTLMNNAWQKSSYSADRDWLLVLLSCCLGRRRGGRALCAMLALSSLLRCHRHPDIPRCKVGSGCDGATCGDGARASGRVPRGCSGRPGGSETHRCKADCSGRRAGLLLLRAPPEPLLPLAAGQATTLVSNQLLSEAF